MDCFYETKILLMIFLFFFFFLDQRYSLEIILISKFVVVNREINEASGITGGNTRVPRSFHVIADALVG